MRIPCSLHNWMQDLDFKAEVKFRVLKGVCNQTLLETLRVIVHCAYEF
jgi:hypothetical protein